MLTDETVDLPLMLREIAASCEAKLRSRGVELVLTVEDQLPGVRGHYDRVKQVMEHLLNNAAQAIAVVGTPDEEDQGHSIRITASHSDQCVHLIVSDTGAGFAEPARVFDPFYTTKSADLGRGWDFRSATGLCASMKGRSVLSICIREGGGCGGGTAGEGGGEEERRGDCDAGGDKNREQGIGIPPPPCSCARYSK